MFDQSNGYGVITIGNRRESLAALLAQATDPVTGLELAHNFGVTRQVIVQDIAILRAEGNPIIATPQGYFLAKPNSGTLVGRVIQVITITHTPDETEKELLILVDAGVEVLDVSVDHPIYGEFSASLMLSCRRDVLAFTERVRRCDAPLLLSLADGTHRHTLAARDKLTLDLVIDALSDHFPVAAHDS